MKLLKWKASLPELATLPCLFLLFPRDFLGLAQCS